MRASQADKARSRERIVAEAARLARERGFEGAGVSEVMRAAGLTHGGFYKHFESKEAMLAAALEAAFRETLERFAAAAKEAPGAAAERSARYMSDEHVRNVGRGCPVPALAADVGRASPAMKALFGAGIREAVDALAQGAEDGRDAVARDLAMRVGAVLIARASDPETGRFILDACRSAPSES